MPANKGIISIIIMVFTLFNVIRSQIDWFGPDKEYKCRCETNCDVAGTFVGNGKCNAGWFGFKCQYQDLAVYGLNAAFISIPPNISRLTDRDDLTCWPYNSDTIEIQWNSPIVFTWFRVAFNSDSKHPNLTLKFKRNATSSFTTVCSNHRYTPLTLGAIDIFCDMSDEILGILISGSDVKRLCTLNINGGRNIALKQIATQSSTYTYSMVAREAWMAIDGNTSQYFDDNSCTHTEISNNPSWTVTFHNSFVVSRYVIFNRDDNQDRLQRFQLIASGPTGQTFNYIDNSSTVTSIYTILDKRRSEIQNVTITSAKDILTLCEVEIYGECPPKTWNLNCQNCSGNCPNSCNTDDGSCNLVCHNGSSTCTYGCKEGYYGVNCNSTCPKNCFNNQCDSVTGHCFSCISGKYGYTCEKKCPDNCLYGLCDFVSGQCSNCTTGFHGNTCSDNCSANCLTKSCFQNGHCSPCKPGYQGDSCETECDPGFYGINCSHPCSDGCEHNNCNTTMGHCFNCKPGLQNLFCDKECNSGFYGINCSLPCSDGCEHKNCNTTMGHCFSCKPGLQDLFCDKVCKETKYGRNCSLNCSTNCTNAECHTVSGECKKCNPGLQGIFCDKCRLRRHSLRSRMFECNKTCCDQLCHPVYGKCYVCSEKNAQCFSVERHVSDEKNSESEISFASAFGAGLGAGVAITLIVALLSLVVYRYRNTLMTKKKKKKKRQQTYNTVSVTNADIHHYEDLNHLGFSHDKIYETIPADKEENFI